MLNRVGRLSMSNARRVNGGGVLRRTARNNVSKNAAARHASRNGTLRPDPRQVEALRKQVEELPLRDLAAAAEMICLATRSRRLCRQNDSAGDVDGTDKIEQIIAAADDAGTASRAMASITRGSDTRSRRP